MKLFKDIYHWIKKIGKKEFVPKAESMTVELSQVKKRKHKPITLLSKSGVKYRIINHDTNKKANSPAYTQIIKLK